MRVGAEVRALAETTTGTSTILVREGATLHVSNVDETRVTAVHAVSPTITDSKPSAKWSPRIVIRAPVDADTSRGLTSKTTGAGWR
jgi:hypothetical protein